MAPLWCDLEFVPNSRGNKAAANLRPTEVSVGKPMTPRQSRTLICVQYDHDMFLFRLVILEVIQDNNILQELLQVELNSLISSYCISSRTRKGPAAQW